MDDVPPQEGNGVGQIRDLLFDVFKGAVSLFSYEKHGTAKLRYLGGIFGRFVALRRAPGVTDKRCVTLL